MNKIIAIFLVAVLCFSLAACGENKENANNTNDVKDNTSDVVGDEGNQNTNSNAEVDSSGVSGNSQNNSSNNSGGSSTPTSGNTAENTTNNSNGGANATTVNLGPKVLGIFYRDVVRQLPTSNDATVKEIDKKADVMLSKIENYPDSIKVSGTTYYVSASGDDKNDGKSSAKPKKTFEALRGQLKAGDAVLFKRGDIFRGEMKLVSGVSYGAYGSGIKPRFYGSVDASKKGNGVWKETDTKGVYVFSKIIKEYSNIVFNNGEAIGRPVQKMENMSKRELNVYYKSGKVYVYSPKGNPADIYSSIEIAEGYTLIRGDGVNDNIKIQNFCIMYAGVHGIGAIGNCDNLEIEGCVIGYAGGKNLYLGGISIGNGIEVWASCSNLQVHDNYVFQCFDAGITHQSNDGVKQSVNEDNIHYKNNLVEYCIYSFEAFTAGEHNGYKDRMGDVYIEDNICRYAGWGWGYLDRPDKGVPCHLKYRAGDHEEPLSINNNVFDRGKQGVAIMATVPDRSLMYFTNNIVIQEQTRKFMSLPTGSIDMNGDYISYLDKNFAKSSGNKFTILK